MAFNQGSIFRPKRQRPNTEASEGTSFNGELTNSSQTTAFELTKNEKYCVSKLPALPSVLEHSGTSVYLNGYSDHVSGYSLVVNEDAIHVWNYNSTDPTPLTIQFPLKTAESSMLPLAIMTNPSSGTSQDPGLVIIDSSTGLVKFYESVHHAPALGLINNKQLELKIPINTAKGEYITLAENVEPAGIALATSWKRCVLLSLRDFKSKPKLSYIELLRPSNGGGIISSIFGSRSSNTEGDVKDEIVSIKSGNITNHGLTQEIVLQDSRGEFHNFSYHLCSTNCMPYIDKKRTIKHNLAPYLENNIDCFLPGSCLHIKFLDLWPLLADDQEKLYLALCFIDEMPTNKDCKSLLLITMKIDDTGVLVYGSHKLSRYDKTFGVSSKYKPKLYVPRPNKNAFILVDNSVILTDIDTTYIQSKNTVEYYKPRYEDIISFKSQVKILGQGFEDQAEGVHPALILLTQNSGVLRVERFLNDEIGVDDKTQALATDPFLIVKSHIEQAIFYSNSSSIDFDINQQHNEETIIKAVHSISSEILDSSSPYLPKFLPSTKDFLTLKAQLYHELLKFLNRNFSNIKTKVFPEVCEYLEKTEVALNLWECVSNDNPKPERLIGVLKNTIRDSNLVIVQDNEDHIRFFFNFKVHNINQILTSFIERLMASDYSNDFITHLITRTVYDGIYLNEERYLIQNGVPPVRSWVFDTTLILGVDEVFTKSYAVNDSDTILTKQKCDTIMKLCEVLYFFITRAISIMASTEGASERLQEYENWYNVSKYGWIKALIDRNLKKEAFLIAEKHQDLQSLAHILESERRLIFETHGEDSEEYLKLTARYSYFIEKFGYSFASSLFDFYLKNDNIQSFFIGSDLYKLYVKEYFQNNPEETAEISWVLNLLEHHFTGAANILINSGSFKEDDSIQNKELKFSLAKLSAIAARQKTNDPDSSSNAELIYDSNKALAEIRIQNKIYQELLESVGGKEQLLTLEFFLKNFLNESIDSDVAAEMVKPFYDRFSQSKQLSATELIMLLTIFKNSKGSNTLFSYALKIASNIPHEKSYNFQVGVIWLRLLVTTDDWSSLSKTDNVSDDLVKERIHRSALFQTMSSIDKENESTTILANLLSGKLDNLLLDTDDEAQRKLNLSHLLTLLLYINQFDLQTWVNSIKLEQQLNPGSQSR